MKKKKVKENMKKLFQSGKTWVLIAAVAGWFYLNNTLLEFEAKQPGKFAAAIAKEVQNGNVESLRTALTDFDGLTDDADALLAFHSLPAEQKEVLSRNALGLWQTSFDARHNAGEFIADLERVLNASCSRDE